MKPDSEILSETDKTLEESEVKIWERNGSYGDFAGTKMMDRERREDEMEYLFWLESCFDWKSTYSTFSQE